MLLAHSNITTTGTPIQVYTVPNGKAATVTLRLANRTTDAVKVRVWVSDTNTLNDSFIIAYDYSIQGNDVYTEVALVLDAGDFIFVQTNTSGVSAVVWGFEQ